MAAATSAAGGSRFPPVQERLRQAAAAARDLLAHTPVERWELFAKGSFTREIEVSRQRPLQVVHTEETGIAIRTSRPGRTGFAAASGLEVAAARTAIGAALACEAPTPVDPLPPPHLLGLSPIPQPVRLAPQGWASHLADRLANALASASGRQLGLLRTVVQEGSFGWLLATADGHVATFEGTSISLLAELVGTDERSGVWREWVHVADPERLDVDALAAQIGNRALLTRSPVVTDTGSRDVIMHGEVVAHLLAALVPLFLARPAERDPLPRLLDREGRLAAPALSLVDDRTSTAAPVVGPCDGEGLPARRTVVLEAGIPRHRLASYRDAVRFGESPRGGAVRLSYRDYPTTGIANLLVDTADGVAPARMLAETDRALFLLRPLAPVEVDLARDAYRLVASGVWLSGGKVRGWQPVVELRGGLGLLLRRIEAVATDLAWYQGESGFIGAPTLLVRRQPVVG